MPAQQIALDELNPIDRDFLNTTLREHQERSTAELRNCLNYAYDLAAMLCDKEPDPNPSFPITQDMLNTMYTFTRCNIEHITGELNIRELVGWSPEEPQEQQMQEFLEFIQNFLQSRERAQQEREQQLQQQFQQVLQQELQQELQPQPHQEQLRQLQEAARRRLANTRKIPTARKPRRSR